VNAEQQDVLIRIDALADAAEASDSAADIAA
jgi:hypothetical protein